MPQPPDLDAPTIAALLPACLDVPRVVGEVAAGAPYADVDGLVTALERSASSLTDDELDTALSHHPRIGERAQGEGREQAFSAREQQSVDADDDELNASIAQGNLAYEERFDRVFLIRAKGRTRSEILAELNRRIVLDDADERRVVVAQLTEIAALRARATWAPDAEEAHA